MTTRRYVVILMGRRNPWDGEGALRIIDAADPEAAVRAAHTRPPSTLHVRWAWVHELAADARPVMVPADVPKPEWGKAKQT